MTVERIRDWQRAFKGAPGRRVPFGAHAVKYLLHLLEQHAATCRDDYQLIEKGIEDIERALGNQDPPDAPWIKRPRTGDEWRHRYDPREPVIGENANPIPDGVHPYDQGTDDYPEFEQYAERTHEEGLTLTSQERADEAQLRERERKKAEEDDMDLSHLDAPAPDIGAAAKEAVEEEVRKQGGGGLDDFFG
jgi:hypothetical protein